MSKQNDRDQDMHTAVNMCGNDGGNNNDNDLAPKNKTVSIEDEDGHSHHHSQSQEHHVYIVTGKAGHDRLAPLLPSHWKDVSPSSQVPVVYPPLSSMATSAIRLKADNGHGHGVGAAAGLGAQQQHHQAPESSEEETITTTTTTPSPTFVWENQYHARATRPYRDTLKCYSHLPHGCLLDDKWALARLSQQLGGSSSSKSSKQQPNKPHKLDNVILKSHCFIGPDGFRDFCHQVELLGVTSTSPTVPRDQESTGSLTASRHSEAVANNNNDEACQTQHQQPPLFWELKDVPRLLLQQEQQQRERENLGRQSKALDDNDISAKNDDVHMNVNVNCNPSNQWVIKDASSNGAGGIWFVCPKSVESFMSPNMNCPLLPKHKYVAQPYVNSTTTPPLLYDQRKFHVRAYAAMTCQGDIYLHRLAFLHVANRPFAPTPTPRPSTSTMKQGCNTRTEEEEGEGEHAQQDQQEDTNSTSYQYDPEVHITNCCANSHDQSKFAGEIVATLFDNTKVKVAEEADGPEAKVDTNTNEGIANANQSCDNTNKNEHSHLENNAVDLEPFVDSMCDNLKWILEQFSPFVQGGTHVNAFQYLGLDFMLTLQPETESTSSLPCSSSSKLKPCAHLLEINAPPSQDTATGLDHAEYVHNTVLQDWIDLWIVPSVTGGASMSRGGLDDEESKDGNNENKNGWKRVHSVKHKQKHHSHSSNRKKQEGESVSSELLNVNTLSERATKNDFQKQAMWNKLRWKLFDTKCANKKETTYTRRRQCQEQQHHNIKKKQNQTQKQGSLGGDELLQLVEVNKKEALIQFVRQSFPYFNTNHGTPTTPRIFFENGGGTQVPHQVVTCMTQALCHRDRSVVGAQLKHDARKLLLDMLLLQPEQDLSERQNYHLYLGPNATSLLSTLAHHMVPFVKARMSMSPNNQAEIVIAEHNHDANITPWLTLASQTGAKVRWWTLGGNNDGNDPIRKLKNLVNKNTVVVAMAHASNVLGQCYDIAAVSRIISSQNRTSSSSVSGTSNHKTCHLVVDGVAAIAHRPAVVATAASPNGSGGAGADWYVVSCHKWFGPHLGALCGTRQAMEYLSLIQRGKSSDCCEGSGGGNNNNSGDTVVLADRNLESQERWEVGTINAESCAGVQGMAQYWQSMGSFEVNNDNGNGNMEMLECAELYNRAYSRVALLEQGLVQHLLAFLESNPLVKILREHCNEGEGECKQSNDYLSATVTTTRLPLVSFVHRTLSSRHICQYLRMHGIVCRHGSFLAPRVLAHFGVEDLKDGVCRLSLAHYNTQKEVDEVKSVLSHLQGWSHPSE
jgi:selenocysteine lyase/cysteine desulfurase